MCWLKCIEENIQQLTSKLLRVNLSRYLYTVLNIRNRIITSNNENNSTKKISPPNHNSSTEIKLIKIVYK
jgi:hypothetical protein